jgi:hypothetical protein
VVVGPALSHNSAFSTIAKLVAILGYFFAMHLSKNPFTLKLGRTKVICLLGLIFQDRLKQVIPHHHLCC